MFLLLATEIKFYQIKANSIDVVTTFENWVSDVVAIIEKVPNVSFQIICKHRVPEPESLTGKYIQGIGKFGIPSLNFSSWR